MRITGPASDRNIFVRGNRSDRLVVVDIGGEGGSLAIWCHRLNWIILSSTNVYMYANGFSMKHEAIKAPIFTPWKLNQSHAVFNRFLSKTALTHKIVCCIYSCI